jgi:hypothetical protein
MIMSMKPNALICLCLTAGLAVASSARAGLVAWWKLNETSGTMAADSSGNGHDGTVTGTAQWSPGRIGGALRFDGSTTYVDCGLVNVDTAVTGGITVTAWVNITSAGADYKLCSNQQVTSAAGGGFTCGIYNGRLSLDSCSATARNLNRDSDGSQLTAGAWKHVAFVLDDVANAFREYQDGTLVDDTPENVSIGVSTQSFRIGSNSPTLAHYYQGLVDDLRVYDTVLNEAEIKQVMQGGGPTNAVALRPQPAYEATDVPRDAELSWKPGEYAATHDVYLGTVSADVEAASRDNPLGVLVQQDCDANVYDPTTIFEFGQTYYWRVDEVNAPGDFGIFKGNVWSFTVEPQWYVLDGITATASIPNVGTITPQVTVDRSGLDANDLHSNDSATMWLGSGAAGGPVWIQYEFDNLYKVREMWVWNYNSLFEPVAGFGLKDVTIDSSIDGAAWTQFGDARQFARAPGLGQCAHDTITFSDGIAARYTRINVQSSWGGLKQYGLSEVRFYCEPTRARDPQPASGATGVRPDVTLRWRAGRDAVSHQIYLGTDSQAVGSGAALFDTAPKSSYTPDTLELDATYYWRIDEVNDAKVPASWEGDIWSFSTAEYLVVDDFESYGNASPKRVFQIWIDGGGFSADDFFPAGHPGNGTGSLIGYDPLMGDIMETATVHGGSKSMPFYYDNSGAITVSEAVRTFDQAQDWTRGGIRWLVIYFYGDPGNTAAKLYVKVNDTKIPYNGDAADLTQQSWYQWNTDLSAVPTSSLQSVKRLTIGVETASHGRLLFDDVRLYKTAP